MKRMENKQGVNVEGGFYTAVVIEIDLFESRIIDERHFATEAETMMFKETVKSEYIEKNISCVIATIG